MSFPRFALGCLPVLLLIGLFERPSRPASQAEIISHIQDPEVDESSGVVASRVNRGLFWTHNDSGDGPNLYAFDRTGASYGHWRVPNAQATDWEDIALAGEYLYAGDIGDNQHSRGAITVYRIREPRITGKSCASGCTTEAATPIRLRYPDRAHNAEALLVHPVTGDLYIVTKADSGDPQTLVFRARAGEMSTEVTTLKQVATLNLSDPTLVALLGGITGGDISPDGRHVTLCDYVRAYIGEIREGADFDDIWKAKFTASPLPLGFQIEAIAFEPAGLNRILTSEGENAPIIELAGPD